MSRRPDSRIDRTRKHPLGDLPGIALGAPIAGADPRRPVERFGRVKIHADFKAVRSTAGG